MICKMKLRIADVIIKMQSSFFLQPLDFQDNLDSKLRNFLYQGKRNPQVIINVNVVKVLPRYPQKRPIFIAYHSWDGSENWRLFQKGDCYIYQSLLTDKSQVMAVNRSFNRVDAYLLPRQLDKDFDAKTRELVRAYEGFLWKPSDIIYDFLQVLLINFLSLTKKDGIFIHGMGLKDAKGAGLLFAGKSKSGKTTLAKIYHQHSRALVLNDDRIIARKIDDRFYIYSSPWHGEFGKYLGSHIERVPVKNIFLLQKAKENSVKPLSRNRAFRFLYPATFPTFWDRKGMAIILAFLNELLAKAVTFRLRFKKDKSVIAAVREVCAKKTNKKGGVHCLKNRNLIQR